jgi:stage II sporulation protein P
MDALYPSLARPLNISQYRYNQDVCPGALLIEVGTNGNTLSEAVAASRLFADAASQVILELEKN